MIKSKEKKVRGVEADLLKTAAKQAAARKGGGGGRNESPLMTYKDKDEQMLRDKLINRLKEKEASLPKQCAQTQVSTCIPIKFLNKKPLSIMSILSTSATWRYLLEKVP